MFVSTTNMGSHPGRSTRLSRDTFRVAGVVVAAAVVREGTVLTARRIAPASLAGRWEFPGGKVEPGESEPQALIRELREELSLEVRVCELLGRTPLGDDGELALYLTRAVGGAGAAERGSRPGAVAVTG